MPLHKIGRKIIVDADLALELAGRRREAMMNTTRKHLKHRLSMLRTSLRYPVVLQAGEAIIGTLGNFSVLTR